ncbi:MAG: sodium:solute symporter family protein [Bacteroidota bacterium]
MLGLALLDWLVLGVYIAGITWLGLWVSRSVATTGDYFMGGRRFGRLFMVAQAFGTGTRTSQVVAVSGTAAQVGFAGIWVQWMYLFSTPFFWLLAPVYRRLRYITIGDFFEHRYGASMGAAYAAVGLAYFAVTTGVMLKGAGVTVEAITAGAVTTEMAVVGMMLFFLAYSLLGGLVAAVTTQAVQGLFILLLSFMLIPFALSAAGGLSEAQAALPASVDWFGLFANTEITGFYVVMGVINALVGVTVQPHHMAINGAGKDEVSCRTGWTYGNFLKRFATLGWAFSGIFITAAFLATDGTDLVTADRGEREMAFGLAARAFLPAGLVGLLLAAVVAAVVASASGFMTGGSALFTRNFYRRYLRPAESERHYLNVGRVASVFVVATGVATALLLPSVLDGLEWVWRIMAFLGIAFWLAIFWRRANRYGAWASLVAASACAAVTTALGWSFPAQIALYLPVGIACMVGASLVTPPEDEAALNTFYSLLRTPVGEEAQLREAGIETIHERQDHEVEREAVTASTDGESATVPTLDDPTPEHVPLLSDDVAARRGESLLLVNLLSLGDRFSVARYRADLGGFLVAWGLVAGFLVLALALTAWLG